MGKGLFAKKSFSERSVIFEEEPLVACQFSWNAKCKYRACDHCLRPLETAEENARRLTGNTNLILPYPECCTTKKDTIVSCEKCGVEYCSPDCLTSANSQYHQTICLGTHERNGIHPLELLDEAWRNIHFPPETNSVMLIVRLLSRIVQCDDPQLAISQILQFCHRTVNEDNALAHKLLGYKFSDQIDKLRTLMQQAFPHETIQQFVTVEGFKSLLALIGTNGQGTGTSALSQWVSEVSKLPLADLEKTNLDQFIDKLYQDIDDHTGSFLNNEGVALYMLQSAANHSCLPNAEVSFLHNNTKLSLVALRDINEGEEIFISYLGECDLQRSRVSRHRELMENYLFECECEKCLKECDNFYITSDEDEDIDV
ncbi:histone-lysine N-trimethyltransferase SMYD5 isoform X2 [Harmonia axyridis]|uniref:histone-lysine N-trimethyltransferase SMYD5 isoform X2 n=1 Tax=Harmonia axyridis TaxID=115357 RepID=UPI001E277E7B|nr:histone-lysine N-trimethyltransferase SMYD5 isoform X2 [Harmonia axyridis]